MFFSYGEIMERTGKSRHEVIKENFSFEGSIAYEANIDRYIITYNEIGRTQREIYWTLSHEFGHYLLQHNKQKNTARLNKLKLKKV